MVGAPGFEPATLSTTDDTTACCASSCVWGLHDLRVSFRSRMPVLKVPEEVAEASLSHGRRGLVGVYNKYRYLDEKREAMELYAEWLTGLVGTGQRRRRRVS